MPQAQNITVIPGYLGDGNVEITLLWAPSVKEDPELDYCLGSRNWKVRVLGYSNIAGAPSDYEVRKEPSISWIKIEKQNTSYLFSEVFSSNVYYSFQVGHREDLFSESQMHRVGARPGVFASPIYYFGFQGKHVSPLGWLWPCGSVYITFKGGDYRMHYHNHDQHNLIN